MTDVSHTPTGVSSYTETFSHPEVELRTSPKYVESGRLEDLHSALEAVEKVIDELDLEKVFGLLGIKLEDFVNKLDQTDVGILSRLPEISEPSTALFSGTNYSFLDLVRSHGIANAGVLDSNLVVTTGSKYGTEVVYAPFDKTTASGVSKETNNKKLSVFLLSWPAGSRMHLALPDGSAVLNISALVTELGGDLQPSYGFLRTTDSDTGASVLNMKFHDEISTEEGFLKFFTSRIGEVLIKIDDKELPFPREIISDDKYKVDFTLGTSPVALGTFFHELGHLLIHRAIRARGVDLLEAYTSSRSLARKNSKKLLEASLLAEDITPLVQKINAAEEIKASDLALEFLRKFYGDSLSEELENRIIQKNEEALQTYDAAGGFLQESFNFKRADSRCFPRAYSVEGTKIIEDILVMLSRLFPDIDELQIPLLDISPDEPGENRFSSSLMQIKGTVVFLRQAVDELGLEINQVFNLIRASKRLGISINKLPFFDDETGEPLRFLLKEKS